MFRQHGGTVLKNEKTGSTILAPPQNGSEIQKHMRAFENFINSDESSELDSNIEIAIIHHQLESIHPFSDANG